MLSLDGRMHITDIKDFLSGEMHEELNQRPALIDHWTAGS